MSRVSALTPLQLAQQGVEIRQAAALLVLRRGCSLGTATRAMREAYEQITVPVAHRLQAGLRETVCRTLDVPFGPVLVGAGCAAEADGYDYLGNPTASTMTDNREAIVPAMDRARYAGA